MNYDDEGYICTLEHLKMKSQGMDGDTITHSIAGIQEFLIVCDDASGLKAHMLQIELQLKVWPRHAATSHAWWQGMQCRRPWTKGGIRTIAHGSFKNVYSYPQNWERRFSFDPIARHQVISVDKAA